MNIHISPIAEALLQGCVYPSSNQVSVAGDVQHEALS